MISGFKRITAPSHKEGVGLAPDELHGGVVAAHRVEYGRRGGRRGRVVGVVMSGLAQASVLLIAFDSSLDLHDQHRHVVVLLGVPLVCVQFGEGERAELFGGQAGVGL